jgi:hydroxyethylthiazole kinase
MTVSPGTTLRELRERKPLVHQITNYVVMNETANATLALGALPVMAHAPEEVEEMVGLASALVLNIGTLSEHWIEAMLLAGRAASERGIPVVLDPVGAGATAYRTDTARRILDQVRVTVLRGNAGEVATLVGTDAEVRGVESMSIGLEPAALARQAARGLGVVVSVTGPIDNVSDGEQSLAVRNGDPVLAVVTGPGCILSRIDI